MDHTSLREFLNNVVIPQPDGSMAPLKDYQIDLAIEISKLNESGYGAMIIKPRSYNHQRKLLEIIMEYNQYLK